MDWIDVTAAIYSGMPHWPGDEEVAIERTQDLERGDPYNLSRASLGLHAGTHVDAPLHFLPRGAGVDDIALRNLVGPARVLEIMGTRAIGRAELEAHRIEESERILLKTDNSTRAWEREPFREDYASLTLEAALFLAERRTLLAGIDYLSIAPPGKEAAEVHRVLLGAGVVILEGLVLSGVAPGVYELVCLPLRVARGDGAPARAILRSLHS
ncbi:MAG: cyclase family protein [Actinobacteria bacterium]|nr:cyclase family protein [Actinomycetota bacterium]